MSDILTEAEVAETRVRMNGNLPGYIGDMWALLDSHESLRAELARVGQLCDDAKKALWDAHVEQDALRAELAEARAMSNAIAADLRTAQGELAYMTLKRNDLLAACDNERQRAIDASKLLVGYGKIKRELAALKSACGYQDDEDGFGTPTQFCPECHGRMELVRPGKYQHECPCEGGA